MLHSLTIDLISLFLFLPPGVVTAPEKTKVRSVLELLSLAAEFSFWAASIPKSMAYLWSRKHSMQINRHAWAAGRGNSWQSQNRAWNHARCVVIPCSPSDHVLVILAPAQLLQHPATPGCELQPALYSPTWAILVIPDLQEDGFLLLSVQLLWDIQTHLQHVQKCRGQRGGWCCLQRPASLACRTSPSLSLIFLWKLQQLFAFPCWFQWQPHSVLLAQAQLPGR